MIYATLYSDPACPVGLFREPGAARDGVALWLSARWRLVLIGLTEDASQYEARGYTPLRGARGQLRFRRYGMPFSPEPKARITATARACRAVVAARIIDPGSEWRVFRALELANFTTLLLLDDDAQLADALGAVPGLHGQEIVARLDDDEVIEAYERDRARRGPPSVRPRSCRARPPPQTDRCATPRRRSSSSAKGASCRRAASSRSRPTTCWSRTSILRSRVTRPPSPLPLLQHFTDGLTTQEVAALLTEGNDLPIAQLLRRRCSSWSPRAMRCAGRSGMTRSGKRPEPVSTMLTPRS